MRFKMKTLFLADIVVDLDDPDAYGSFAIVLNAEQLKIAKNAIDELQQFCGGSKLINGIEAEITGFDPHVVNICDIEAYDDDQHDDISDYTNRTDLSKVIELYPDLEKNALETKYAEEAIGEFYPRIGIDKEGKAYFSLTEERYYF